MRIVVSGQKQFGADAVELCLQMGHEVLAVAAPPHSERKSTDGKEMPDRTRAAAERHSIPWIPSDALRGNTMPHGADLLLAAHSHAFISRLTRYRTRLGAIGYHPSLLPLHRGRDAVRWAIHMGDRVTGGSVYWLTDTMDGGPIAAQQHVFIPRDCNASDLWSYLLHPLGIRLLACVLRDLSEGKMVAEDQDESLATWEPSWERQPAFRPELPQLPPAR